MKKILTTGLMIGILSVGMARIVSATPIDVQLDKSNSSVGTTEDMKHASLIGVLDIDSATIYHLLDNSSVTVNFFKLTLDVDSEGKPKATGSWTVTAELDFSLPFPLSPDQYISGSGGGTAIQAKGSVDGGMLKWTNPTSFLTDTYGNKIEIDLSDQLSLGTATFSQGVLGDTVTQITAKITNLGGGIIPPDPLAPPVDSPRTDPVPEPGTMLLLGTGLAGLIISRRRKVMRP